MQALAHGLQANESLKSLTLYWWNGTNILFILPSLHDHPTLTKLTLANSFDVPVFPEFQESLRTWLSRADCKLEEIDLNGGFRPEQGSFSLGGLDCPNTSLRNLQLKGLNVNSLGLSSILPDLNGLVTLNLRANDITDMEPLDCLLLGESCRLEKLILDDNPIGVASATIFAEKLPRMKVLRQLCIGFSPFTKDEEFLGKFANYVYQNKSLELLRICTAFRSLKRKIAYGPCLNRAGRRYLENGPGMLPLQLLPTVLVRAREVHNNRAYSDGASDWMHGLDATFWLLRQNDALFSHLKNEFLQD